jgi:hypothetical protein
MKTGEVDGMAASGFRVRASSHSRFIARLRQNLHHFHGAYDGNLVGVDEERRSFSLRASAAQPNLDRKTRASSAEARRRKDLGLRPSWEDRMGFDTGL